MDGPTSLPLPDDQPAHPVRDLTQAGRALDRARGALELEIGAAYRRRSDAWLVIDGSLSESPDWAADARAVGVSKSHATLPFDGAELERYLRLPSGQRTSVFAPASRSVAPVLAWAVRLWPWEDRDLFYGLVRVEVAPVNGDTESADLLSRRLLAERAPLSTPDPRWDRLFYGIHSVEQYLRARAGAWPDMARALAPLAGPGIRPAGDRRRRRRCRDRLGRRAARALRGPARARRLRRRHLGRVAQGGARRRALSPAPGHRAGAGVGAGAAGAPAGRAPSGPPDAVRHPGLWPRDEGCRRSWPPASPF